MEASQKRYRFTAKEPDDETGFYYIGARYYAPWLGRWTAPDPVGLGAGTNMYRYASCNPATKLDPDGKTDWFFTELRREFFPPTAYTSLWLAINALPSGPRAGPAPDLTKKPRSEKEITASPGPKSAEEITKQREQSDLEKKLASSKAVDPFSTYLEIALKSGLLTNRLLSSPSLTPPGDPSTGPFKYSFDRNPDTDIGGFVGKLVPKVDQKPAPFVAYTVPPTLAAGMLKPQGLAGVFKTLSFRFNALDISVDSFPTIAPFQNNYFGGIFNVGATAAFVAPTGDVAWVPDHNGLNTKAPTYKWSTEQSYAEQARRWGRNFSQTEMFYNPHGPRILPREIATVTTAGVFGAAAPVGSGPVTFPAPSGPWDASGTPQATPAQATFYKPSAYVGFTIKGTF